MVVLRSHYIRIIKEYPGIGTAFKALISLITEPYNKECHFSKMEGCHFSKMEQTKLFKYVFKSY